MESDKLLFYHVSPNPWNLGISWLEQVGKVCRKEERDERGEGREEASILMFRRDAFTYVISYNLIKSCAISYLIERQEMEHEGGLTACSTMPQPES